MTAKVERATRCAEHGVLLETCAGWKHHPRTGLLGGSVCDNCGRRRDLGIHDGIALCLECERRLARVAFRETDRP